jgi:hypothetical protein
LDEAKRLLGAKTVQAAQDVLEVAKSLNPKEVLRNLAGTALDLGKCLVKSGGNNREECIGQVRDKAVSGGNVMGGLGMVATAISDALRGKNVAKSLDRLYDLQRNSATGRFVEWLFPDCDAQCRLVRRERIQATYRRQNQLFCERHVRMCYQLVRRSLNKIQRDLRKASAVDPEIAKSPWLTIDFNSATSAQLRERWKYFLNCRSMRWNICPLDSNDPNSMLHMPGMKEEV